MSRVKLKSYPHLATNPVVEICEEEVRFYQVLYDSFDFVDAYVYVVFFKQLILKRVPIFLRAKTDCSVRIAKIIFDLLGLVKRYDVGASAIFATTTIATATLVLP